MFLSIPKSRLGLSIGFCLAMVAGLSTKEALGNSPLPMGLTIEQVVWDAQRIAHVDLQAPGGVALVIEPVDAMAIEEALARELDQPDLAGLAVRVRVGDGPYFPLENYAPYNPLPPDSPISEITGKTAEQARLERQALMAKLGPEGLGGPIANADGQPQGALSGVVVFVAAGHGWTDQSSNWYLQRPLLLDMVEDYGNLDQLNIFVNYLYNAGAIVVPFRPVGLQPAEIVLDNDDAGVTYSGSWNIQLSASVFYENGATSSGVDFRYAVTSPTQSATARYTPTIPATDFYPVYTWVAHDTDRVNQVYHVRHSGGTAIVSVDHQRVGSGWIWLGTFHFEAGTSGYVEISNQSPLSGIVVADAIRFGCGIGDVVGAGSGHVSGYPRDEEASRYWAESEAGINAVGPPSSIWDCCSSDGSDNVGTAARWGAYMNRQDVNNQRWRRVYVEFHSNAAGCSPTPCGAKGTVCLVNSSYPTTNQQQFSTIVGDKIEADLTLIDNVEFEYLWGVRSNPYAGVYGAISTQNNDNEFDATLVEVAFHDNIEDTANLRNVKVRDAVARSTLQGMVTFLSSTNLFPDTQVPNVFLPDPPENVRAICDVSGNVVVSWAAPPTGGASGSAATGYKVYRSSNGYGFGNAVTLGNVLTATLTNISADTVTYLRVSAINAGGESMPSETIAVRRPPAGVPHVLVVNGFDRVSRQQNAIQTIPSGPMERQIARRVNAFDYIVQHASALDAAGVNFDACANDAVIGGQVQLGNYNAVVWILGEESERDKTFTPTEQALTSGYLNSGGNLFVTGSEIGYELDNLNAGRPFYENTLKANYVGDDAGTYNVVGSGGILADVGAFDFNPATGAPYDANAPDRIAPQAGAITILTYSGGTADGAGIQYDSGIYKVVMFGFPFETITTATARNAIMHRVMNWLAPNIATCPPALVNDFEGYNNGDQVMFQNPRYSGSTLNDLAASPNLSAVATAPVFNGTKICQAQWAYVDTDPQRWLRLTTTQAAIMPSPAIDLTRPVRFRFRLDTGALRMAIGVRETGVAVPIGQNGGSAGTIEWIGAGSAIDGAPQGRLISSLGGLWQTVTFVPTADQVLAFTGDSVLSTPNNMGVFEHIALSVTDSAGPFSLMVDKFEQLCALDTDFDDDNDVDLDDFAHLQLCLTGPGVVQSDEACRNADLDSDLDVDADDLDLLGQCLRGENIPADANCIE